MSTINKCTKHDTNFKFHKHVLHFCDNLISYACTKVVSQKQSLDEKLQFEQVPIGQRPIGSNPVSGLVKLLIHHLQSICLRKLLQTLPNTTSKMARWIHSFIHCILSHAIVALRADASIAGSIIITVISVRSFMCTWWCSCLHTGPNFTSLPEDGHFHNHHTTLPWNASSPAGSELKTSWSWVKYTNPRFEPETSWSWAKCTNLSTTVSSVTLKSCWNLKLQYIIIWLRNV